MCYVLETEYKPKANEIKAKMRKTKQRFIQKNGKDSCCGKCTNCNRTDCGNWWEYWFDEILNRERKDMTEEQKEEALNQLLYDIKNVYTEEEKSKIVPWYMIYKYKRFL